MTKYDDTLFRISDIPLALSLLSRIPVRVTDHKRTAKAVWAYPLAGACIGLIAGLAGCIALLLGLPSSVAAIIALMMQILVTGALHEDGLADTADGFWGGWNTQHRLDIMKDSRIGAYGVIALVLSIIARYLAFSLLFASSGTGAILPIIAVAALSRTGMPMLMTTLPSARSGGLAQSVGTVGKTSAYSAVVMGSVIMLLLTGSSVFPALFFGGIVLLGIGIMARRKISGYTGDVLGASQQLIEITVLFCLIA